MLTNGLMDLNFWTCFPEVRWIEVWTCFLEVRWIGIFDVLPRGLMDWNLGRASQRSKD